MGNREAVARIVTNVGTDRFVKALFLVVLVAVTLHLGRLVFEPVGFVLFIMALVEPFRKAAEARLGKSIALILTIVLTLVVLSILVGAIVWSIGEIVHWSLANTERFEALYRRTTLWMEGHGIFLSELSNSNKASFARILGAIAGQLNYFIGFSLVVVLCLLFGLAEIDAFRSKIIIIDKNMSDWSLLETSRQIARKIRKYMLIRTLASMATGISVFVFALLIGLDLPLAWGVIAFVLNYIPYIGTMIATVLPVIFSMAQFESWQTALIIFGSLYLIQFAIGSYLEPLLTGTALAISPFVMLIAFLIWDFLWGMPGSFIGLPATIALYTVWEQNPSTRWLANLMATSGAADAPLAETGPASKAL